jgi:hypothetical protein
MEKPVACALCNEHGHTLRKCPQLTEEINRTGFYKPAGGMPQGGDDDEHVSFTHYHNHSYHSLPLQLVQEPVQIHALEDLEYSHILFSTSQRTDSLEC